MTIVETLNKLIEHACAGRHKQLEPEKKEQFELGLRNLVEERGRKIGLNENSIKHARALASALIELGSGTPDELVLELQQICLLVTVEPIVELEEFVHSD